MPTNPNRLNARGKALLHQLETGEPVMVSQAQRVIDKFGGATRLAKLMGYADKSAVYRWTYPKGRQGCGGVLPNGVMAKLLEVARQEGVYLTADDFDPRPKPAQVVP